MTMFHMEINKTNGNPSSKPLGLYWLPPNQKGYQSDGPKMPRFIERERLPVNPCQLAGLRAMTIHAAPLIITIRSPGRLAKAARAAAEARARMSSG